jgi:maleate isomerase
LDLTDVDVLVASACVQMPSLEAIDLIQKEIGIPVTSAAICTTYEMMKKLGIEAKSPIGGALLNGTY